ncbi:sigma factor-like helix-turn-helix DNA-binding protein [Streptomyces sp. DSM 41527]|uniref:Sigma factor-like helix-turn-helix DNA-binding protein n=1 Tax=Streptomyces mooreae TaxID=3075523 RepID=A0ABU2T9L9_9ACTN|nr:sigma factor-like helix-turn-helix DNA-binding protein [Streptomyces sp. DSM 41527]MDT0457626.1 sigma factor-like helix-turn-helix DNA-binding protein [Streptomyces sp. DSM 41527]
MPRRETTRHERARREMTGSEQAAAAFDDLHTRHAAALMRQTYLLTGRPWLARRAVQQGFRRAWQHWPQVAVDPDPAGWVRAAAYEYALTPWHRLCPGLRTARKPKRFHETGEPADRALLAALLRLPAPYRRALLLHDGVGLGLYETAAEIEASTPAAAGRLTHARERLAERLPELGLDGHPPVRQGEILRDRLTALTAAQQVTPTAAERVRSDAERSDLRTTRAAVGLAGGFALVAVVMMLVTPDHYTPPPDRPLATAPHAVVPRTGHRGAEVRKQGNAAVRKRLREARLAPDVR